MSNKNLNIQRLYIHVPFCSSKCDYCAFHSIPSPDSSLVESYLNKLSFELNKHSHVLRNLKSIFIGGGTPSFLQEKQLGSLFNEIYRNVDFSENPEISIECNPESLTTEKIKIISDYANRVSLGIQSFEKEKRIILGRTGSLSSLDNIISLLTHNGIDNLSADLIYGIPGQSLDDWNNELQKVLDYPFKHISAYSLTLEAGTELINKLDVSEDYQDLTPEMWHLTGEILSRKNLVRYEVSNYSLQGFECNHNLEIWFGDTYLGLGPTASSFDGKNRWTEQNFFQWIKEDPPEPDIIPYNERIKEIFVMGLRTNFNWTIDLQKSSILLKSKFGQIFELDKQTWTNIFNSLLELENEKLISLTKNRESCFSIKPTDKGLLFWNEIGLTLIG